MPISPAQKPDTVAQKIGDLIAELFIVDGATLQYGIGQVPEAVTAAVINKGVKDIGIYTELFSDAMKRLIDANIVTNKYSAANFAISTLFLASEKSGYD